MPLSTRTRFTANNVSQPRVLPKSKAKLSGPRKKGAEKEAERALVVGVLLAKFAKKLFTRLRQSCLKKTPYHADCFKCASCEAVLKTSAAGLYEDKVYCKKCFEREGFAQKQGKVKWEKKEGGDSAAPSKFGGGGNPCTTCGKTVYPAETVSYDKKLFHADCLCCSECSKKCNTANCAMFEEKVYCTLCFERGGYREKQLKAGVVKKEGSTADPRFAKFGGGGNKCRTCGETVYPAETIAFEGNMYHQKCFVCLHCKKEVDSSAAEHNGPDVYCKRCFHELGLNRARLNKAEGGDEVAPAEDAAPVEAIADLAVE